LKLFRPTFRGCQYDSQREHGKSEQEFYSKQGIVQSLAISVTGYPTTRDIVLKFIHNSNRDLAATKLPEKPKPYQ
jgi:hypothetical protein